MTYSRWSISSSCAAAASAIEIRAAVMHNNNNMVTANQRSASASDFMMVEIQAILWSSTLYIYSYVVLFQNSRLLHLLVLWRQLLRLRAMSYIHLKLDITTLEICTRTQWQREEHAMSEQTTSPSHIHFPLFIAACMRPDIKHCDSQDTTVHKPWDDGVIYRAIDDIEYTIKVNQW